MRSARLDIRNKNGLTPVECMAAPPPAGSTEADATECRLIVKLSTTLQSLMAQASKSAPAGMLQRPEKILTNDLTRAKETNPIQVVNAVDDSDVPTGFTYVSKNCVTNAIPLDRDISKMQVGFVCRSFAAVVRFLRAESILSIANAPTPARVRTPATAQISASKAGTTSRVG